MFTPTIDLKSPNTKVTQLVEQFRNAIMTGDLAKGDKLPSVNTLMKDCEISRDTVVKVYNELKGQHLVIAAPQKGYFVTENNKRLLLVLDTFKAYKEELYAAIIKNLPDDYEVELVFHHYNVELLESVLNQGLPRCSCCAVMSFDIPKVSEILSKIPKDKLLAIDWNIGLEDPSFIGQDFGQTLEENLGLHLETIKKYEKIIYLYPKYTYHPEVSTTYFSQFCEKHQLNYEVKNALYSINKGELYLLVSDRNLATLLTAVTANHLELGKDIGILSYNETPLKKYVRDGISVISTDFTEMGKQIADWTQNNRHVHSVVPTEIILRASL